jgi:hypothetical protein
MVTVAILLGLTAAVAAPCLWGILHARTAARTLQLCLFHALACAVVGAISYWLVTQGAMGHELSAIPRVILLWFLLAASILTSGIAAALRVLWMRSKGK